MFKKTVAALMLAGLASGQAFALQDAGAETDVSGFITINAAAYQASAGQIGLIDDRTGDTLLTSYSVDPVHGSFYALIVPDTTASLTSYTFNLAGTPTVAGDSLYFRLFSAEQVGSANYTGTDGFTVTYFNINGTQSTYSWTVADSAANGSAFDSGWLQIAPLAGTQSMMVSLYETSADGLNNPVLAVDFSPAAPVPEPESIAMMLAGLGVLGAVSRRRAAKKKAA